MSPSDPLFHCQPGVPDAQMGVARIARTRPHGIFVIELVGRRPIYVNAHERTKAAGFDFHLVKQVEPDLLCRLLDSIAMGQEAAAK